ncbi:MAG: phosphatidylinositol mannoside acyltransferase [Acidimicrobiales bacterium]|nr:phosphatidylinositol mannoside acyltransferase [Acidimicrobiales bacterium]
MGVRSYRLAAAGARRLPRSTGQRFAVAAGRMVRRFDRDRRAVVEQNLRRIIGDELDEARLPALVDEVFTNYARYYHESFRLPALSVDELDAGYTQTGYHRLLDARENGHGPILALPHLGSWEWAGFWLHRVGGLNVTAVVERLDDEEVFDWFVDLRHQLGMNIVSVGPGAGSALIEAIKRLDVVVLLCDRHVGEGSAVEVEFFGERAKLPAGPATLALRTGAPLLPTAVYTTPTGCHGIARPAIPVEREGKFRADVQRITQLLAYELEIMIRKAPTQWHVLQPIWPA